MRCVNSFKTSGNIPSLFGKKSQMIHPDIFSQQHPYFVARAFGARERFCLEWNGHLRVWGWSNLKMIFGLGVRRRDMNANIPNGELIGTFSSWSVLFRSTRSSNKNAEQERMIIVWCSWPLSQAPHERTVELARKRVLPAEGKNKVCQWDSAQVQFVVFERKTRK